MQNKTAIYIRVSTQWQVDKDSLQVQRRELIAYSELVLGNSECEVFEDPGYSAKNTDRPAYQEMMTRLRTGEFSHLLVWKIDRISRNLIDFANMYTELRKLGVIFVSKNEQFDTSSAIGEAMLKIILVFAELERNMTAERVTAVMISRASAGKWNGGKVPFGYTQTDGIFSIDQNEAEIYRYITQQYLVGNSVTSITKTLNDRNITTHYGNKWSPTTVHKLLTNPFYTGSYRYNVMDENLHTKKSQDEWILIENHHEALISQEDYNRIQNMLKRNRRGISKTGDTYTKKNVHIFGGILFCDQCGGQMLSNLDRVRKDGWRPSIYACSQRRRKSNECTNKYVSDVTLGPFVFTFIGNILEAQKYVVKSTSAKTLKKRLLRGLNADIKDEDISMLLTAMKASVPKAEYKPEGVFASSVEIPERDILLERRSKNETALARLQTIYLYSDESMPEKDYITLRKDILDDQKRIDDRLKELDDANANKTSMEAVASYRIMAKMLSEQPFEFEKFSRSTDHRIPKNFLQTIFDRINISDGHVSSIQFKNRFTVHFSYESPSK